MSQVLLRRFAGQDGNGGAVLIPYDIKNNRELKSRGTAACARVDHFVPWASQSLEELWQTVENKMGAATDRIEQGRNDLNTIRAIRDAIALHLTRSTRYMRIHEESALRAANVAQNKVLVRYYNALGREYFEQNGRLPDGPRDLIDLADRLVRERAHAGFDGSDKRIMIEEMFRNVKQILNCHALEIWTAPPGCELLVSDAPAFTIRYSADRSAVPLFNVAVGDAHAVVMPLSRTTLACVGKKKKRAVLTVEQVDFFNRALIQNATRFVYYRPGSQLKNVVSHVLSSWGSGGHPSGTATPEG
ncbi:DUF4238 domain-containing protein [Actinosynnema pretiosum subsp. pretiosum]|uniref:DUF4238 domain-containing protein n=1 Tax=Actinosynnema pretiosum subsp. pretiosum TaxID=103721 RepID=A0AA45L8H6_9PSEU|nr:DUF4238 domain-containing protein [Actinosynnema pretiosum subsp. pretiosum]